MDVQCPQCETEYELEEERIAPTGTTVKCTACGYLFHIFRSEDLLDAKETSDWTIWCSSGEKLHFRELTTLQKWIVEQKVGREDKISKNGKSWKKLKYIQELSSFFAIVENAKRADTYQNSEPPHPAPPLIEIAQFSQTKSKAEQMPALRSWHSPTDSIPPSHRIGDQSTFEAMTTASHIAIRLHKNILLYLGAGFASSVFFFLVIVALLSFIR